MNNGVAPVSDGLDLCQHQLPPNDGQHQDGRSELQ